MTVSKDDFAHRSGAAAGLFAGCLLFTCRSDAVLYHLVMSEVILGDGHASQATIFCYRTSIFTEILTFAHAEDDLTHKIKV